MGWGSFAVDVGRGFSGDFGPNFVGDLGTSAGVGFKGGGFGRSLAGSLANMSSFGGRLEEDVGRGFSGDLGPSLVGDLGPSAELGLEDEFEDGPLGFPVGGMSKTMILGVESHHSGFGIEGHCFAFRQKISVEAQGTWRGRRTWDCGPSRRLALEVT